MKNKKIALLTLCLGILAFFGITILIIPNAKADVGQYEQQTDPSNPFLFSVDTIYFTSDGWIHANGAEYFYHQVFLEADKYYLFYDPIGYMNTKNAQIQIHLAISITIDYYYEYSSENTYLDYFLYINPSQTGLYNITIRWGIEGFASHRGSYGIGILEIPIVPLDTELSTEYWDFYTNAIMVGIIELDAHTKYQTGYNGRHCDYLGGNEIYYSNINSLYSIPYLAYAKLDCSHDIMNYSAYDIITTKNLGQGAGNYIFYSLYFGSFSLMEAEETEENKPNILPNILPIIIILSIIGVAIGIGVYVIYRKRKRKDIE